jgi:alpha-L-fucosidase
MNIRNALWVLLYICVLPKCYAQHENAVNSIEILPQDNLGEIIRKSTLVLPSVRQYEWQSHEFMAFIHFGPNTFNRVEWGSGKENPAVFNPTELNADQWISTIKAAGMKMAMITAKHHDGFCLWQSTVTKHSVASSPWKNGKGDVLKELTNAASKQDIKIGVYLSPADMHEIESKDGRYGNKSAFRMVKIPTDPELQKKAKQVFEYNLDDYNAFFMNQLYEVLTQYGQIYEVWFDGANPKPGTGQTYNYKAWFEMIHKLQPMACIAIKGPDVRWCGNEGGETRESEWSVVPLPESPETYKWPDMMDNDLGSREKLKNARYLHWYPAETNTSIRAGWFYRDEEQQVKTVNELVDNWYRAVGGNSVFLLNITPDRRGLIPDKDVARLKEVGQIIGEAFTRNLVAGSTVSVSNAEKGFPGENMNDGKLKSYWKSNDGVETPEITIQLSKQTEFNRLVLQEEIRTKGQRIEAFVVDILEDGKWREITKGTVVGYKNIRRFPMVKTDKLRIRILASRISPTLSEIGIYKAPEMLENPSVSRSRSGRVRISCPSPDPEIYYTIDGTEPTAQSARFEKPFALPEGGIVKTIAIIDGGKRKSETSVVKYDICSEKWNVVSSGDAQNGFEESKAIDGDPNTICHTSWEYKNSKHPLCVTIDLGENIDMKGFTYLPRADKNLSGVCENYTFEISSDGKNWTLAKQGRFDNIRNNPVFQEVFFGTSFSARFIRFTSISSVNNDSYLSIAEIGVLTK